MSFGKTPLRATGRAAVARMRAEKRVDQEFLRPFVLTHKDCIPEVAVSVGAPAELASSQPRPSRPRSVFVSTRPARRKKSHGQQVDGSTSRIKPVNDETQQFAGSLSHIWRQVFGRDENAAVVVDHKDEIVGNQLVRKPLALETPRSFSKSVDVQIGTVIGRFGKQSLNGFPQSKFVHYPVPSGVSGEFLLGAKLVLPPRLREVVDQFLHFLRWETKLFADGFRVSAQFDVQLMSTQRFIDLVHYTIQSKIEDVPSAGNVRLLGNTSHFGSHKLGQCEFET